MSQKCTSTLYPKRNEPLTGHYLEQYLTSFTKENLDLSSTRISVDTVEENEEYSGFQKISVFFASDTREKILEEIKNLAKDNGGISAKDIQNICKKFELTQKQVKNLFEAELENLEAATKHANNALSSPFNEKLYELLIEQEGLSELQSLEASLTRLLHPMAKMFNDMFSRGARDNTVYEEIDDRSQFDAFEEEHGRPGIKAVVLLINSHSTTPDKSKIGEAMLGLFRSIAYEQAVDDELSKAEHKILSRETIGQVKNLDFKELDSTFPDTEAEEEKYKLRTDFSANSENSELNPEDIPPLYTFQSLLRSGNAKCFDLSKAAVEIEKTFLSSLSQTDRITYRNARDDILKEAAKELGQEVPKFLDGKGIV